MVQPDKGSWMSYLGKLVRLEELIELVVGGYGWINQVEQAKCLRHNVFINKYYIYC